jgi:hypothetical protein
MAKVISEDLELRRNRIIAYHICIARDDSTLNANAFILRIINLLTRNIGAYAQWIRNLRTTHPVSETVEKLIRNHVHPADLLSSFKLCVSDGLT